MKLLVIGIDALMPDLVFNHLRDYPTLKKLIEKGISGSYDTYVYGYGSHDNWISMYTGLEPKEHKIIKGIYQPEKRLPRLYDYSPTETFWKVLNKNGFRVGMWKGLATSPPEQIDGFMVSGELALDNYWKDPEIAIDGHMFSEKDKHLHNFFEGDFPKLAIPKSPKDFGYTWDEIYKNPQIVKKFLDESYFEEGYEYFKKMLEYSLINIRNVHEVEKVDLFWFYNSIFDYLGHFTMHDVNRTQLKKALKVVDNFVKELLEILQPENIMVLSDHGQKSYIDHFPNCDIPLQIESFGLADQCVFLGDSILMRARTEGFMSSLHSLKGTIILSGIDFKQGKLDDMRTLDIYPMILELFECKIPKNRKGLVPDVFNKEKLINNICYINSHKPNKNNKVLMIQTCEVNIFNGYINDFYNEHRFNDIYVYGPERYRSIFLENDQVAGFIAFDENYNKEFFDNIIVPYSNSRSCEQKFINIE